MFDRTEEGDEPEERLVRIRQQARLVSRWLLALLIAALLLYGLVLRPLPYYIMTPGSAEAVRPMVQVKAGAGTEKGTFLLTTVSVSSANVSAYLWARLMHEELVPVQSVRQPGESAAEYDQREQYVMLTSQANAVQAAYRQLGIPYHIASHGVRVLSTVPGMPAAGMLQPGDTIVAAEDQPVASRNDLLKQLAGKKTGDFVRLTLTRDGKRLELEVAIGDFPANEAATGGKSGLGIVSGDVQAVEADDPARQVTVEAGDIGGPSAGLMFALEMINQLQSTDLTRGYRIAGTGEIAPDGTVGVIGGIKHKVVAANRQKADLFFAPNDYTDPAGNRYPNATDARAEAASIGTKMKIVPVGTLQEALAYLASLPIQAEASASP